MTFASLKIPYTILKNYLVSINISATHSVKAFMTKNKQKFLTHNFNNQTLCRQNIFQFFFMIENLNLLMAKVSTQVRI